MLFSDSLLGSGRAAEVIDVGVNGVRVTPMLMESIRAERSPDRRGQRAIAIHGGGLENLGSQRSWSLSPFTWEIHHASISPSVGRSVVLSHDQPRQCEGVSGIQPWTARTATLVLRPHWASDYGKFPMFSERSTHRHRPEGAEIASSTPEDAGFIDLPGLEPYMKGCCSACVTSRGSAEEPCHRGPRPRRRPRRSRRPGPSGCHRSG